MWRRLNELGLSVAYLTHARFKKCIRRFLSMGYLPVAVVRQNFQQFCASRERQRLIRRYPELRDFILYLQRNYFDGNFPPLMWNVYNRDSETRTNNFVEAFHSGWNLTVGVRHPSLWTFLRHQKDSQAKLELQADAADRGDPCPPRKRKWRQLESRIRLLKEQYEEGNRTLTEYWKAVAHCTTHFE
ncbi:flywch-type Zinc finger-containing protein 1 [Plakobranchus ocellatus]|uniref:Flywch-type Zinc finger-containing protein 1 n=1 Tax=Plakobranchus ocellatus TaxID=259542 RepID=A0AAV3YKZ1_9GAST|nr:flywch-type Zinc finger-containing protein 1 [Plakobranchus ocellatus]